AVQTPDFVVAMSQVVQGALYPAVRPKDIRTWAFPLPPRREQRQITETVDELLSELEAGVTALMRVRERLNLYRASVLKAAVEEWVSQGGSQSALRPLSELIGSIAQGWSPRCDLTRAPHTDEWAIIKTTAVQSM